VKRALAALALLLAVLAGVAVVRAFSVRSLQPPGAADADPFAPDADAVAARLAGAIRFQTVSQASDVPPAAEAFAGLHAYLAQSYPRTHEALGRETVAQHSLLYTWSGRSPGEAALLLAAHLDVVPVPDAAEWKHAPFAGEIAEGEVWGRGALDDKGSLIAIFEAVESLLAEGFAPERTIYLAFGHDEEIGGRAGARVIAETLAARGVRVASVLDEGGAVADGFRRLLEAPVASIGVAEKGWADVRLRVEAPGGHSSTPPRETAIGILGAALVALERNPMPAHVGGIFEGFVAHIAPEASFPRRLALSNLWLLRPVLPRFSRNVPILDAMIRTTTAPTIVRAGVKSNVLPREAEAIVNFRILPGDTVDDVLAHVRAVVDDERVAIELSGGDGGGQNPSAVSPDDGPAFRAIARAATAAHPGAIAAPFLVVGGTDAKQYAPVSDAIYRLVPFKVDEQALRLAHGKDERVAVSNLVAGVRFYRALLKQPLSE
jgi:carboxypeptidase PM20D1